MHVGEGLLVHVCRGGSAGAWVVVGWGGGEVLLAPLLLAGQHPG